MTPSPREEIEFKNPRDGRVMTIQVRNGLHPDHPDAVCEYECHVCGETGTSFGAPRHIRRKPDDLRDLYQESPIRFVAVTSYECSRQVLARGGVA